MDTVERGFLNVDDDIADHLDADDLAAWGFDDSVTRFCPHLHKSDKCGTIQANLAVVLMNNDV